MGDVISDKLISDLIEQAQNSLCRSLWAEYQVSGKLKQCPSYPEAKALAHILNKMTPFSNDYCAAHFSAHWLSERGKAGFKQ